MPATIEYLNDALIQIGDNARVERGPLRRTAIASAALLTSYEAQVAQFGSTLRDSYQIGALDSDSNVIVEGQEFAFLDWNGTPVWHVYEYCTEAWTGPNTIVVDGNGNPVPHEDPELAARGVVKTVIGPAWRRRGHYVTQAEAVAAATVIATQGA
jgi:hypothetical protein